MFGKFILPASPPSLLSLVQQLGLGDYRVGIPEVEEDLMQRGQGCRSFTLVLVSGLLSEHCTALCEVCMCGLLIARVVEGSIVLRCASTG